MLIIGERINSARPKIRDAIKNRNASFILKEARQQIRAGASFLDVNCAQTQGDELLDVDWVISVIQSEISNASICIDSPNYMAIERALKTYKGNGDLLINSITGETAMIDKLIPLAVKYNAKVVALTMDEHGMPGTSAARLEIARKILEKSKNYGLNTGNLFFDPLIRPIATEPEQAKEFLNSLTLLKSLENVRTVCGLSNISFGLPARSLINSVFLSMAIYAGLDAAILDPLDEKVSATLSAARALLGQDDYSSNYIKAFRARQFNLK